MKLVYKSKQRRIYPNVKYFEINICFNIPVIKKCPNSALVDYSHHAMTVAFEYSGPLA